jgi:hypothetical protein
MKTPSQSQAIKAIDKAGALLAFPIDNRPLPASLWSSFYPKSEMRWEWDSNGDDRVPRIWILREELSRSGKVVYSKWYRGRATFFSRELFTNLLAAREVAKQFSNLRSGTTGLSRTAIEILEVLEMDSPLSTKELKAATDLQGKFNEKNYEKALKELWSRFLIVGFGEKDDGAFPSLRIGATKNLFEDLWTASLDIEKDAALDRIRALLPEDSLFLKHFFKKF